MLNTHEDSFLDFSVKNLKMRLMYGNYFSFFVKIVSVNIFLLYRKKYSRFKK